jgi:hypothetical protein
VHELARDPLLRGEIAREFAERRRNSPLQAAGNLAS